MQLTEQISVDAGVQGGRPVLRGTRVPVHVIVGALAAGDDTQTVCAAYGITDAQLRAVLTYAADRLTKRGMT